MTYYHVTIAHAVPPNFTYGMGHPLSLGEPTYYEAMSLSTSLFEEPEHLLEVVWAIGNVDSPEQLPEAMSAYAADAGRYRELGNRSLSVGDVVVLANASGSTAWICAPVGWEHIEVPEVVLTPRTIPAPRSAAREAHDVLNAR